MLALDIKNVSYTYNKGSSFERVAVDDVNLSINDGEIIGVIGQTGSGKSTFVQMLNGLIKPTSGNIFLYGKDIWQDYKIRKEVYFKVGLVFQYPENQLFSKTVYDDIAFGPKNQGFDEKIVKEKVCEALGFVGLEESFLERSPFELSGGEKRKVAIAGIFATNSDILILDEPTSGLDPISGENIMSNILNYHKTRGKVIIFISHSMDQVAEISDKVVVMNNGRVWAVGAPENVFCHDERTLKNLNLNTPQITKIISNIQNKGYKIDKNIVTINKGTNEIVKLIKNRKIN